VKHHVKKNKKHKRKSPGKEELLEQRINAGLNEFAGSSAEEDDLSTSSIEEPDVPEIVLDDPSSSSSDDDDDDYNHDDDNGDELLSSNHEEEEDYEDGIKEVQKDKAVAMADVMSRILGTTATATSVSTSNHIDQNNASTSVVLSKTVTKLQRQQETEKKASIELHKRRKANLVENLSAMVVPTILNVKDEDERAHRRVATRGVVALFNAIAKHQNNSHKMDHEEEEEKKKKKGGATVSSKHDFLEKLKQNVIFQNEGENKRPKLFDLKKGKGSDTSALGSNNNNKSSGSGWKALKDDYLMGSNKLKDWDKGSSSSDSGSEEDDDANLDDESRSSI